MITRDGDEVIYELNLLNYWPDGSSQQVHILERPDRTRYAKTYTYSLEGNPEEAQIEEEDLEEKILEHQRHILKTKRALKLLRRNTHETL